MIDDFSPLLAGEIPFLDLADVQLRIPEQPRTVCFHRTHMVSVLMGDKDMAAFPLFHRVCEAAPTAGTMPE